MRKKENVIEIIEILKKYYPDAKCSLDFKNAFEITIAVMLSAQCTDERVNKVTPNLFKIANSAEKMLRLKLEKIEEIIKSCGFYKNKAKNILACSKMLVEKYNGEIPNDIDELQKLPGIGRKSANVIMLEAFNNPQGIAIDTHAKRIVNKLGLSNEKVPEKIEKDLLKIIPKEYYVDVNHLLVYHGRNICVARSPKCEVCNLKEYCENYKKGIRK